MINNFVGIWYVTFLCDNIGPGRSLIINKLATSLVPSISSGRIYMTVNNLAVTNSYMHWESRETYTIRIKPRPEAQAYIDFTNARIISYGTQIGMLDDHQQLVYEMSWIFTGSNTNNIFRSSLFNPNIEEPKMEWQDVGF